MYHYSSFTNHHSSLSCTSHHKSNLLSMFLIYVFMYLCTHVWRVNTHSGKDFWIKTCKTSTTPSCGRPLRAQIFRKVCFYEQKYDFWHVRVPFALFNPPPLNSSKNRNFHKWYFSCFSFVTLSLLAKNYASITKIVNFGPLGPFCPIWKGPRTHQKRKFSKITMSSV